MKIAIIGAGAYGCYTIDKLQRKFPNYNLTLFEVGDKKIKSEEEAGYQSNILNDNYSGLSKGRFFGFGGSTKKWGGQLLTFSENDFSDPTSFLKDIVNLNEKHHYTVFKKFGIKCEPVEERLNDSLYIKTGFWLGYFKRNLFSYFKIASRKNVQIISNARVIKIMANKGNEITKIIFIKDGLQEEMAFDYYFLTAGAFESYRLLLSSGLISTEIVPFSDHLSLKVFKIKNSTKIGDKDFAFKVKGLSLITKRIIGEVDGVSYFVNPIFNSESTFFQNLKRLLFKQELNAETIKAIFKYIPDSIAFVWTILVKRRIYVFKNEWYFYIDIENPVGKNNIKLSEERDMYNEKGLDISFFVDDKVIDYFQKAKSIIKDYLIMNNVDFEECDSEIQIEKCEDTYHPFGMLENIDSVDMYFRFFDNMLVVNTGVLPRAGGINTTASVFPLIEEYVDNYMN
jgi:hypothetical protein